MYITLKEAAAKMLEAENLVITTHVNPDGDALGSSLALYQMLVCLGKNVEVLVDDDIPESFGFLPDIETIQKPEKESYPADYLIMLDVSKDRIGQVLNKCQAPIINIDHHRTNDGEADFLYLDAEKAATAEIIYQLAQELAVTPDSAVALCIYTGLSTDTGNFRFRCFPICTRRIFSEQALAKHYPLFLRHLRLKFQKPYHRFRNRNKH